MIRCIPVPLINRIARIHHDNLGAYRVKRDKLGIGAAWHGAVWGGVAGLPGYPCRK